MFKECANPDCRRELHYLRDGTVYVFRISAMDNRRLEHFWLCGECAKIMTLICVDGLQVKTMRIQIHRAAD